MKKLIAGSLMASMLVVPAMAQDVSVYLNNERMVFDQNPIIENGRTLVPLRSIFEGLGAEVKWDAGKQEIIGTTEDKEIILRIGDTSASVNDEEVILDVPAKIKNGRTLVPLRFISESLDAMVKWDADEYRIDIEENKFFEEPITKYENGKFGLINDKGEEIIPCKYDEITDFKEGIAKVRNGNMVGFIDITGKEIIPCSYDTEGVYHPVFYIKDGFIIINKGRKSGIIDKTGKEIIPCSYNSISLFYEGLATACKNDKWGYIDKNGNEIVDFIYDDADIFNEGLAKVCKNDKWGYIDKNGNEIVDFMYDEVGDFSEGLAKVCKNNKWGYIDKNGNEIVDFIYDTVEDFKEGAVKVSKDGDYCIIRVWHGEKYGYLNSKYGIIDISGKEIIPCVYDKIIEHNEKYMIVSKDGEYKKSESVNPIGQYSMDYYYLSGKYGCIDKKGNEILPCIYSSEDEVKIELEKLSL